MFKALRNLSDLYRIDGNTWLRSGKQYEQKRKESVFRDTNSRMDLLNKNNKLHEPELKILHQTTFQIK